MIRLTLVVSFFLLSTTLAFLVDSSTRASRTHHRVTSREEVQWTSTLLHAEKKKKGGLDENVRNKLVTESIAPWRSLRLFLYAALGSGAFLGGLVNLSETLAAMSGAKGPEVDMSTEVRTKSNWRLYRQQAGCCTHSFLALCSI
jgi:hypothetical protein